MGPLPPASMMQVLINGRGKRTRKPRFSATLDFALIFSRLRFLEPLAPVQVQEAHA